MSLQSDTWVTTCVRPIYELDCGRSVYHPTMVTEPEQNSTQLQDEGQTPEMDKACGVEHRASSPSLSLSMVGGTPISLGDETGLLPSTPLSSLLPTLFPPREAIYVGSSNVLSAIHHSRPGDGSHLGTTTRGTACKARCGPCLPEHPSTSEGSPFARDHKILDLALPFDLRSFPRLFTSVADVLEWILRHKGVSWRTHYIDNFLTMGQPNTPECKDNPAIMYITWLGVCMQET